MALPVQQFGRELEVVIGERAIGKGIAVTNKDGIGLRVQFEITKTIGRTPNTAAVKIMNLAPDNEGKIKGEFDEVLVNAGYKGHTALLFRGNIRKAFGFREGNDWITEVDAADGDRDFRRAAVNLTLAAGSSTSQLLDHVIGVMTSTTKGHVQVKERRRLRGKVISKMARDVLDDIAAENDSSWSIQDSKLVIVPADSTLPNEAIVIRADTGMIGAPELDDKGIKVKCLLNPAIRCNGKVWLDNNALKEKIFKEHDRKPGAIPRKPPTKKVLARLDPDGIYKVIRVTHKGDTRGNDWETEALCIRLGNPIPAGQGVPAPTRSTGAAQ
jgi:hypothetical protein